MKRTTIKKICEVTRLEYAQSSDPTDQSWFLFDSWPITDMPDWVPGWMNCSHPDEVYEWISREAETNPKIKEAMKKAGLRKKPQRIRDNGKAYITTA